MKFLKRLGIFSLVIVGIWVVIIGIHFGINKYEEHKNNQNLLGGFDIQNANDGYRKTKSLNKEEPSTSHYER